MADSKKPIPLLDGDGNECFEGDLYKIRKFTDMYEMKLDAETGNFFLLGIGGGEAKPAYYVVAGERVGTVKDNPEIVNDPGHYEANYTI